MSDHDFDPLLDPHLRDVPLPDGLLSRLRGQGRRQVGEWPDPLFDSELRDVPVPRGLVARLQQIAVDQELDEQLRDVQLPWGLLARLHNIPLARPRVRLSRLAVAASLFMLISGAYLALLGGLFASLRPRAGASPEALEILYNGPLEIESAAGEDDDVVPIAFDLSPRETVPRIPLMDVQFVSYRPPTIGPVSELTMDVDGGLDLWQDIFLLRYGPIGAPDRSADDLPTLDPAPLPPRGGVEPPLTRHYNRRFLLLHDVHPPVFPDRDDALGDVAVPLSTSTASFDLADRLIQEHRLPSEDEIRVEDFLAAMQVHPRRPQSRTVALRTSAGPSVFRRQLSPQLAKELNWQPGPASLLHVDVQAGRVVADGRAGRHMTVVVDVSASMRWADRLERTRRALRQVVEHLGPRDRLSLVVFNDQVVRIVEAAGADRAAELCEAIDRLEAKGGTNIAAALQRGVSVALGGVLESGLQQRLVLITDGRADLTDKSAAQVETMLAFAADQGLRFSLYELNDGQPADEGLARLAAAARGDIERNLSDSRLTWSLVELSTGQSSLVARDVVLTLKFRPQAVAAYRLLGHEQTSLAGLLPVEVQAELKSGQAAGALFELWLKPGGEDHVGQAVLEWVDPATGESHKCVQRISRLQFAASFAEASPYLQAAAIAAETAEVLRGSPFVDPADRELKRVLDLAESVNFELSRRPEFQRFVTFIEQAQRNQK